LGYRTRPSQNLLDRGRHNLGMFEQKVQLRRMLEQGQ
jgi:hypothetical protein